MQEQGKRGKQQRFLEKHLLWTRTWIRNLWTLHSFSCPSRQICPYSYSSQWDSPTSPFTKSRSVPGSVCKNKQIRERAQWPLVEPHRAPSLHGLAWILHKHLYLNGSVHLLGRNHQFSCHPDIPSRSDSSPRQRLPTKTEFPFCGSSLLCKSVFDRFLHRCKMQQEVNCRNCGIMVLFLLQCYPRAWNTHPSPMENPTDELTISSEWQERVQQFPHFGKQDFFLKKIAAWAIFFRCRLSEQGNWAWVWGMGRAVYMNKLIHRCIWHSRI